MNIQTEQPVPPSIEEHDHIYPQPAESPAEPYFGAEENVAEGEESHFTPIESFVDPEKQAEIRALLNEPLDIPNFEGDKSPKPNTGNSSTQLANMANAMEAAQSVIVEEEAKPHEEKKSFIARILSFFKNLFKGK